MGDIISMFLIIVSQFPLIYVIQRPVTSTAVIGKTKSLFAEEGVPQRVISQNGRHVSSDALRRLAGQWCFDHITVAYVVWT